MPEPSPVRTAERAFADGGLAALEAFANSVVAETDGRVAVADVRAVLANLTEQFQKMRETADGGEPGPLPGWANFRGKLETATGQERRDILMRAEGMALVLNELHAAMSELSAWRQEVAEQLADIENPQTRH